MEKGLGLRVNPNQQHLADGVPVPVAVVEEEEEEEEVVLEHHARNVE